MKTHDENGIYLIPPARKEDKLAARLVDCTIGTRKMMLSNTCDDYIYVDESRFERIRYCKWFLYNGKVVNEHMIPIEKFLGIPRFLTRNPNYSRLDYRLVVYSL